MNPIVEIALSECGAHVLGAIQTNTCHPMVVRAFIERFKPPFREAITGKREESEEKPSEYPHHAKVWMRDRGRITALARAIGALADHIAGFKDVKSSAAQDVTEDDLMAAFRLLSPQCDVNALILKQYCTGIR